MALKCKSKDQEEEALADFDKLTDVDSLSAMLLYPSAKVTSALEKQYKDTLSQ